MTPGEIVAIAVAFISLASLVLGKLVEKRVGDTDQEQEREQEFNKDLWARYKEVMAERDSVDKQNKDLKTLVHQNDEQIHNFEKQLGILISEKAAWEIDRGNWQKERVYLLQRIDEMGQNISWLNTEITKLRSGVEKTGVRVEPPEEAPNGL